MGVEGLHSAHSDFLIDAAEQEDPSLLIEADGDKLDYHSAFSLNSLNMFGTGPFVTIPLVIAAGSAHNHPAGPQVSARLDSRCRCHHLTFTFH